MEQTMKPVIYYSGNTWQLPGDIAVLSGSLIGTLAESVSITRLPDGTARSIPGYPDYPAYDRILTKEEQAFALPPSFREADADCPEIIQRTADSIKFRIPPNFHPGIYSVRLLLRSGSGVLSAYLNTPNITFALGEEGLRAIPGGTLRLCGYNLAPEGGKPLAFLQNTLDPSVRYLLKDALIQEPYSVTFTVPDGIAFGSYRVFLHNGYGDDTAWSYPVPVQIGTHPRSSWPSEVFDVTKYGAVGKGTLHNDTPAIIRALRAAEKNGGGVVYFPKGTYTLVYPVTIPEHVVVMGDGIRRTRLVWIPYLWDFGELPESMITLKGNAEICGIDFTGSRLGPLFTASDSKDHSPENIFIHNCRVYLTPYTGSPTEGIHPRGNGREPDWLYARTYKELNSYRSANGSIVFKMSGVRNLKILDNDIDTESSAYRFLRCAGVRIAGNTMNGRSEASLGGVTAAIIEYNTMNGYANTLSGDGIYCAHNRMTNRDDNNREIMTSDGPGHYGSSNGNTYMDTLNVEGTLFRLDQSFASGILTGKQLLIQEGPGEGQMRRITSNEGNTVTVESPFAAAPADRISKVSIMSARSNTVFYKNYMYNAGDFQFYGTQLNTLVINNTFEKTRGFVSRGCNIYNFLQPNWYISVCGNHFLDANYLHNVGYTPDWLKALPKLEIWGGSGVANNQLCTLVRNNTLEDGFFLHIKGDGNDSPITDLIIQGNQISDADFGIYLIASSFADGVLFCDNTFSHVEKPYVAAKSDEKQTIQNKLGSQRYLFLDNEVILEAY